LAARPGAETIPSPRGGIGPRPRAKGEGAHMTDIISRPVGTAPEGGPIPPQALEAERSVLAALLLDPEAVGRAIEMITPPAFYRVAHQRIYEAIVAIYGRNEKADLVTLSEELRKRGDLEA